VESRRLAESVAETAATLGSRPLAMAAEQLARRARARATVDPAWAPLTARELEVARLIADGRTNADIAAELGMAHRTATSHVEHILAKLGATRRAEVAAWVTRTAVGAGQAGTGQAGAGQAGAGQAGTGQAAPVRLGGTHPRRPSLEGQR